MYTSKGPPATVVTGRNIAHGDRDAVERAFLAADIKRGNVALEGLTDIQISQLVGSSLPYLRAAVKVAAASPELRAQVERHELSLSDAIRSLRPAPQPAPKQAVPDLFAMFAAATPHERAICMSVHIGEVYALLDMATSPLVGPVPPAAGLFAQHH